MGTGNQWSDLPTDLLAMIGERLNTRMDILRFRGVCKSWRSSIPPYPPYPPSPLRLPFPVPPNCPIDEIPHGYITVTEFTIYRLQENPKASIFEASSFSSSSSSRSKNILAKVREEDKNNVCILTPFSEVPIQLWHKKFPRVMNLFDFHVSEIGKIYRTPSYSLHNGSSIRWFHCINKVAVSSSNFVRTGSYAVMAIYNHGRLCFLKSGDEEWTAIDEQNSGYREVISHKGKFYAVTHTGRAIVVDSFSEVSEIACSIFGGGGGRQMHLVESLDDLLLVDRCPYFGPALVKFRVHKLDEEEHKWVEMTSLGERVLFVDQDGSFSVSSRDLTGCEGNCIYYVDRYLNKYTSVFSLEDGRVRPASSFWLNPFLI
ncbi:hypothetical protein L1049_023302 [Liquidambar formosana]|uniref:F-box domain-containing protein n=1 Tax=Liquidambar formosana TaxID=63359 RepID=A0AAP0RZS9_LIQFO